MAFTMQDVLLEPYGGAVLGMTVFAFDLFLASRGLQHGADAALMGVGDFLEELTRNQRWRQGRRVVVRLAFPRALQVDGEGMGEADELEMAVVAQLRASCGCRSAARRHPRRERVAREEVEQPPAVRGGAGDQRLHGRGKRRHQPLLQRAAHRLHVVGHAPQQLHAQAEAAARVREERHPGHGSRGGRRRRGARGSSREPSDR